LFRSTKGNALINSYTLGDYRQEQDIDEVKNASKTSTQCSFIIVFQDNHILKRTVERAVDAFMSSMRIEIPDSMRFDSFMTDLCTKIRDIKSVINMTISELKNFLISLNSMPPSFYNQRVSRI
jgi:hypothetical protein